MKIKFSIFATLFSYFVLAQSAPSYYAGVNFTKTQNDLKADLAQLITQTHTKTISYSELQELMKSSDLDPEQPGNLLLIYGSQSSGTHQRSRPVGGSWNREHVYAKSKGTPNLGTSGPGADGHHLRPADPTLNSTRGNLSFDDGSGAAAYKTARGGWFPGDEWKGDVARILMYMYVRYQNQCQPLNITLNPNTYSADFPDILLKWNVEDPVSPFEKQRQEVVAGVQKNRNPFIDNPYLATVIWGGPEAQNTWPDTFSGGGTADEEAPSVPSGLTLIERTANRISLSWSASSDNIGVTGYTVYVNGTNYMTVTAPQADIRNLQPETTYEISITANDAAGNESAPSTVFTVTTLAADTGGSGSCGTEDFENIPSSGGNPPASQYADRTWSNNGIVWEATNARTDTQIYIDGPTNKAICIRKGSLKSSVIGGGIGTLKVRTYLPFSDSAGSYTLLINGEEKGQIPYSKTAKTQILENINVPGPITIELVDTATNNRVSFDNLTWTCYEQLGTDAVTTKLAKLTVYPNPVKNNEITLSGIGDNETVYIYNAAGQKLQTLQGVKNNSKITLKQLAKGLYFITTQTQSAKMIVQ